ncbi:MAG: ABC transporter ATP-binding protein [Blastocatellia bacterium]|nr:ABC transporter ATP-binding protein [Blastocatellia bacterium]
MSDVAIRVENLGKRFRIGASQPRYRTLRDTLMDSLKKPFQSVQRRFSGSPFSAGTPEETEFWALRDLSFDVQQGEVIGIIGRNGAGKSTLLKILSRITEPTSGLVEIHGRVGSLLEVGTGFHPELTGRENIFLNGAILGMRRKEVQSKFDEIVAFAEVEKFLDTPVRHYSSGMYTRLAFAVAAHLEPEVLLVDEVLAVGDASFQRKCLNKMDDVGKQGRTVFFVSHNMPSITRLCQRVLMLDQGRLANDGPAHKVAAAYLASGIGTTARREWPDSLRAPGNEVARLLSVTIRTEVGEVCDAADIRRPVGLEMEFRVLKPGYVLVPNFHVLNDEGTYVFCVNDHDPEWRRRPRPEGIFTSTAWIPGNYLAEGGLIVGAAVSTLDPVIVHFYEKDAVSFQVIDQTDGETARGDYAGPFPGVVRPLLPWTTTFRPHLVSTTQESKSLAGS